jgi:hypothetical protein
MSQEGVFTGSNVVPGTRWHMLASSRAAFRPPRAARTAGPRLATDRHVHALARARVRRCASALCAIVAVLGCNDSDRGRTAQDLDAGNVLTDASAFQDGEGMRPRQDAGGDGGKRNVACARLAACDSGACGMAIETAIERERKDRHRQSAWTRTMAALRATTPVPARTRAASHRHARGALPGARACEGRSA